jgi:hypothetical protein
MGGLIIHGVAWRWACMLIEVQLVLLPLLDTAPPIIG